MARKSKNLSTAFDRFSNNKPKQVTVTKKQLHDTESTNVTSNSSTEDVPANVTQLSNNNTVTKDVTLKSNTETITDEVTVNSNTKTVTDDVILNGNTEAITDDVTMNSNIVTSPNSKSNTTVEAVKQDLLSMYEEKAKKETVEDTHTRTTFLFRKDLAKRLDRLSKNKRGFKTMFINKAIEALLDEMEEK